MIGENKIAIYSVPQIFSRYKIDMEKVFNNILYLDIITFDYSEGGKLSGDILISIERVKENAATFKISFEKELGRVMVHGILHLVGYKDKTKVDKEQMRKKEDFYLVSFPIL